jgi:hypothetical protein
LISIPLFIKVVYNYDITASGSKVLSCKLKVWVYAITSTTNLEALALFFLLFSKVSKAYSILCLSSSILVTVFVSPGLEVAFILDLPYVYFEDFVGDPSLFLGPVTPK